MSAPRLARGAMVLLGVALTTLTLGGCAPTVSPRPSTAPSQFPELGSLVPAMPEPSATPEVAPSPSGPILNSDSFGVRGAPEPAGVVGDLTCTGWISSQDPVAVVIRDNGNGDQRTVVMDFANPAQPQEVCNLGGSSPFEFLNAQQLVIYPNLADGTVPVDGLVNQSFAVVDLPGLAYHWFSIPSGTETMNALFAVSPKGDQIVWDAARPDWLPFDRIHLSSATPGIDGQWNDSVIATLPDTFGRECGPSNKGNPAAYTTSGSEFFVYDAPMPEISLLVERGGKIVYQSIGTAKADPASRPEHPLWSPVSETLYYTQSGNAWEWTPAGGVKLLLKGVTWSAATVSPDGNHLAYESLEGSLVHVYLVDLAHHGQPVRIGNGQRGAPAFLDNAELYYAAAASGGCGGGGDGVFIYDLRSGTEKPSPVDWVLKTWPATSTAGW